MVSFLSFLFVNTTLGFTIFEEFSLLIWQSVESISAKILSEPSFLVIVIWVFRTLKFYVTVSYFSFLKVSFTIYFIPISFSSKMRRSESIESDLPVKWHKIIKND